MSEITDLKKKIKAKLDTISDRYQLRIIYRMMDRLEELEKYIEYPEHPMPRGENASFYKEKIKLDKLPSTSNDQEENLKDLVKKALELLEFKEQELA